MSSFFTLTLVGILLIYGIIRAICDLIFIHKRIVNFLRVRPLVKVGGFFYSKPQSHNPFNNDLLVCEVIDIVGKWVRYKYPYGTIRYCDMYSFIEHYRHISNLDKDKEVHQYQIDTIRADHELLIKQDKSHD